LEARAKRLGQQLSRQHVVEDEHIRIANWKRKGTITWNSWQNIRNKIMTFSGEVPNRSRCDGAKASWISIESIVANVAKAAKNEAED
jgi:hypothetical protein